MKRIFFLLSILTTLSINTTGQSSTANDVANMLKSGNVNGLSGYFMDNVDLTILQSDDVYSKAQATQVTKKFFEEHPPKGFVIKHEGKSKLDDHYRIGTLSTSKGDFRVTYFLKNDNGSYRIKQLRIE